MSANPDTGEDLYPRELWDELFREMPEQKPQRALFDFDDIDDPSKWDLPPLTEKIAVECKVLITDRKPKRTADESKKIFDEAIEERRAIQPVLEAFGLDYDIDPEAMQLVGLINDNASYPIYQFKMRYARARPWQMCNAKDLDAMFPPGHFLHPGHGAYPSGHATWVHMWVELIGTFDPTNKAKALKAAVNVAQRREIAGLHYPSDSEAGRRLGINIAQRIVKAGRLTEFEKDALLCPNK